MLFPVIVLLDLWVYGDHLGSVRHGVELSSLVGFNQVASKPNEQIENPIMGVRVVKV
jgi:hypothetical protein